MKSILTTFNSSLNNQPFKQESLDFLQTSHKDMLNYLASSIISQNLLSIGTGALIDATLPYVLYGCYRHIGGGMRIVENGAALYNGEVYQVIGAAGFSPTMSATFSYIFDTSINPITFRDGVPHNIHQNKVISIVNGPIVGSIWPDFSSSAVYMTSLTTTYNTILQTIAIPGWTPLSTLTYRTGYTDASISQVPRYTNDLQGRVYMSGMIACNAFATASGTPFVNPLPVVIRPTQPVNFPVRYFDSGGGDFAGFVRIGTDGSFIFSCAIDFPPASAADISLDSINYLTI